MPNIKSAIKRVKTSRRNQKRNVQAKSRMKTVTKKVSALLTQNGKSPTPPEASVRSAISILDRLASKGIIHRRQAARRKSRLAKSINSATKR